MSELKEDVNAAEAEKALDTLKVLVLEDFSFSDVQLDALADILVARLSKPDREWFNEIATSVLKHPKWQVLLGQWLRNHENGIAQAPVIDPSWSRGAGAGELSPVKCEGCGEMFQPTVRGQRFHNNECAAIPEKKRREEEAAHPQQGQTAGMGGVSFGHINQS